MLGEGVQKFYTWRQTIQLISNALAASIKADYVRMALFVEHMSTLCADITSVLKSKVTEWIASQAAFIQDLFGNICWES